MTFRKLLDKTRLKKLYALRRKITLKSGFDSGIDPSIIKITNILSFNYSAKIPTFKSSILSKADEAARGNLIILTEFNDYVSYKQQPGSIKDGCSGINWNRDPKSGYEYEKLWHREIKIAPEYGVEIKQLWDLGRLAHLMDFWLASYILKRDNQADPGLYIRIGNQRIADFIRSNPAGIGVQWSCAMDAAIRAAQICVFIDMSHYIGFVNDEEFLRLLKKSLTDHIAFVYEDLEWSSGMRGNHYLANLCGIITAGSYLENSDKIDSIMKFCINELAEEIMYQFLPDGGNFEASTRYHLFSAEMVLTAILFFINQPVERLNRIADAEDPVYNGINRMRHTNFLKIENGRVIFSLDLQDRIEKLINFGKMLMSAGAVPPQIGDNDSGTFLTLIPDYEQNLAAGLRYNLFNALSDYFTNDFSFTDKPAFWNYDILQKSFESYKKSLKYVKMNFGFYKYFGLMYKKEQNYELFFRCGDAGQAGKGGHAHCDNLSFVLFSGGEEFIVDPGTFCYTSYPEKRNEYRSGAKHNLLTVTGIDQYTWKNKNIHDLFWIVDDRADAVFLNADGKRIIAVHQAFGEIYMRKLEFNDNMIVCSDELLTDSEKMIRFHLAPGLKVSFLDKNSILMESKYGRKIKLICENGAMNLANYIYSPEYGIGLDAICIEIRGNETIFVWSLSIEN